MVLESLASYCVDSAVLSTSNIIETFQNFSVPSFFNYGCDAAKHHNFSEVRTIYGEDMLRLFSGAIAEDWLHDGKVDMGTERVQADEPLFKYAYLY